MHTILPAGVLDASHATDSIILTGWVLDTPLDLTKVKTAWCSLISAWPLISARLHHDEKTRTWEYHIPESFTSRNSFGSIEISAPIRKHYQYATPSPTISVSLKENPHHLFCPHGPTSVADLLDKEQDRPLVHLHVSNFEDGALIGLSTPHILCDGHGVTSIVRALCDLINNKTPPPPLNHEDPFKAYAQDIRGDVEVPAPPHWRVLGKVELTVFYLRELWKGLWEDKIENRDVYFPKEDVLRIKADAMDDVRKRYGDDTSLYVSTSDAILAFCLQCAHPPTRSSSPLSVFYTANLRLFLSQKKFSEPYLHNTVLMPIMPPLPISSMSQMPLGELALHIRSTLKAATEDSEVEKWLRWRLKYGEDHVKVFFDPYRGRWDVVTNWREMNLMSLDFSGAGAQGKARCLYAWGNGLQPYPLKNWIGLWADDASGGIWTSGFLQKKVWEDERGFGKFLKGRVTA